MPDFRLEAPFQPTGDQPQAIEKLVDGLGRGLKQQVLLGVTGSGKSYTISQVIARHNRPTLVLAHNKTLAAQLYSEFREFFPDNAVEYFVSYFDYYQPEAYLPRSATRTSRRTRRATTRSTSSATPRRARCSSGATRSSWPSCRASTASARLSTTAQRSRGCASAAATAATASCASSWISSTSATTPPCRAPGSASVATRSSCSRHTTTSSCASSSSATRWSGSRRSTR